MDIEKIKFDILFKIKLKEYKDFFSCINYKRRIINFKKNLFFVRFYYKIFIKKQKNINTYIKKKKFYFKKLIIFSKKTNKLENENKIEIKRYAMLNNVWKNKVILEVINKFSKFIKLKEKIKVLLSKKIVKIKKKFIKSLKKSNIQQMIKEILEFKYYLILKKQMFKSLIKWR